MKGFEAGLHVLQLVPKMVKLNLSKAKCHCKACKGKNTVIIIRGKPTGRGETIRWACTTEGCGNRGMT